MLKKNHKFNDIILSIEIFLFNALFILVFLKIRSNFLFLAISKRSKIQIFDLWQTIRNLKRFQNLIQLSLKLYFKAELLL